MSDYLYFSVKIPESTDDCYVDAFLAELEKPINVNAVGNGMNLTKNTLVGGRPNASGEYHAPLKRDLDGDGMVDNLVMKIDLKSSASTAAGDYLEAAVKAAATAVVAGADPALAASWALANKKVSRDVGDRHGAGAVEVYGETILQNMQTIDHTAKDPIRIYSASVGEAFFPPEETPPCRDGGPPGKGADASLPRCR